MTEIRSSRLPRLLAAAAIGAAALLGSLAAAAPAAAHDSIAGSSPEAGSSVPVLPDEITLTFSAALLEGSDARVVVIDETCPAFSELLDDRDVASFEGDPSAALDDCTDYARGDAVVEGAMVTQQVDADDAPAGGYAVLAGVVYGDTHPGTWALRFTAEQGAAPGTAPTTPAEVPSSPSATSAPEGDTSASPTAQPDADDPLTPVDDGSTAMPWIVGGSIVVVAGIVLTVVLVARRRRAP